MSSYEDYCNEYAIFGDPERDHYEHEFNAQFDRFDGWDCGDPAADVEGDGPCDHGNVGGCDYCEQLANDEEAAFHAAYLERQAWPDDVPF